ncbi:HinT-interacting membrane complex lipoprotein P60 [Mycoplasma hafezii]|uniref:HinT-interacting membrane complex lipoprotein P60 n=1 Tax=Mycoplasma hafezii TaxID=525886 RepID=UPI003CE87448
MKKWFKPLLSVSSIAPVSIAAVSCGRTENSVEKVEQDKELSNKEVVNVLVENIWLSNTLATLYNITFENNQTLAQNYQKLMSGTQFSADAYTVYKTYVSNKNLTEPGFLAQRINKLLSEGKLDSPILFESFINSPVTDSLTLEQFIALYNNEASQVANETNKILLTYKFFLINDEASLQKIDVNTYSKLKNKYDSKYYNLISYTLNKKLMQTWGYSATDSNAIFTEIFKTIDSIDSYNQFIQNKSVGTVKIDKALWINEDAPYQLNMGGYLGFNSAASGINFAFTYDNLSTIKDYQSLVGFYNYATNKIVPVEKQNNNYVLAEPISVAKNSTAIGISYINVLAPIAKEISTTTGKNEDGTDKVETINVLSFDNTPYASESKLLELTTLLFANDSTLYQNAQNAFVKLGYTLSLKDVKVLNEVIKNLGFIKK